MFNDDDTKNAIDVVATHTYFHNNFTSNWAGLKMFLSQNQYGLPNQVT